MTSADLTSRLAHLLPDDWVPIGRAIEVSAEIEGTVGGRHFTEWPDEIRALKREGQFQEALALCLACVEAAERAAMVDHSLMPPWFTEHAAIIYRKLQQHVNEIAVLHRYGVHPFGDEERFAARINAAFALMDRAARGTPWPADSVDRTARHRLPNPEGDSWPT